jgi:PAS domain S-box-containing protein
MPQKPKKTILLVEDEAIIALAESEQLRRAGYGVVHALSGEEAVAKVEADPRGVDLVLMDINLGEGMDGTEAARSILSRFDLPLLFLSSHTEPEIVEKTEMITSYGYVVKSSVFTVLDASIKMAFKLFDAHSALRARERALRDSEVLLGLAQDAARIGFWSYYPESGAINWSSGIRAIFGLDPGESEPDFAGFLGYVHPDDLDFVRERTARQLDSMGRDREVYVYRIRNRAGELRYLEHIGRQSIDRSGKVTGIYGSIQDITERKLSEEAILRSEGKFRELVSGMQVGVLLQGTRAEVLLSNPKALELLGLSEDQLLGRTSFDPSWNVIHEDGSPFPGASHPVPVALATRRPVHDVVMGVYRPSSGDRVWLSVDAEPLPSGEGEPREILCTFTDITARKAAELEIQGLLREKEIILKEVHHRIKNNMGTIGALLSIQADASADPGARATLLDAASRVQSMMVLYDKLYRSEGSASLSARDYLPALVEEIARLFPRREAVALEVEIGDLRLGAKLLSALGLLVNELLANAMKHAFAGRERGRVSIRLASLGGGGEGRVALVFEDDGVGLPDSVSPESSLGFGMQLVSMLVEQIGGSLAIEREGGTRFIIEFKP